MKHKEFIENNIERDRYIRKLKNQQILVVHKKMNEKLDVGEKARSNANFSFEAISEQ